MPRYADPELASNAAAFADVFGASRARLAILLDLVDHRGATRADIANRTGLGRKLVLTTLQDLVRQELVTCSRASGRQPAHYTLRQHALTAALDGLRSLLA